MNRHHLNDLRPINGKQTTNDDTIFNKQYAHTYFWRSFFLRSPPMRAALFRVLHGMLMWSCCLQPALGCRIHGYDSGYCEDPDDFATVMPFCSQVIPYRACLPVGAVPTGPADDNAKLNAYEKDQWIEKWFNRIIEERIRHET